MQKLVALNLSPALRADAARSLVEAREYAWAKELVGTSGQPGLDLALATFHTDSQEAGLAQLARIPEAEHGGDWYLARALMLPPDEAAAAVRLALKPNPSRPDLFRDAELALLGSAHHAEAAALLNAALKKLPDDPELLLIRAATGKSESQLKEIENRWPDWYAVWAVHAALAASSGHPDDARKMLGNAVAPAPSTTSLGELASRFASNSTIGPYDVLYTLFR